MDKKIVTRSILELELDPKGFMTDEIMNKHAENLIIKIVIVSMQLVALAEIRPLASS